MNVTSKRVCSIKIELDQNEAEWLLSFIQNNGGRQETREYYDYRQSLFSAIKKELRGDDDNTGTQ